MTISSYRGILWQYYTVLIFLISPNTTTPPTILGLLRKKCDQTLALWSEALHNEIIVRINNSGSRNSYKMLVKRLFQLYSVSGMATI